MAIRLVPAIRNDAEHTPECVADQSVPTYLHPSGGGRAVLPHVAHLVTLRDRVGRSGGAGRAFVHVGVDVRALSLVATAEQRLIREALHLWL